MDFIEYLTQQNAAIKPFSVMPHPVDLDSAKYIPEIRRDRRYFIHYPSRRFAIRSAGFEWHRWNARLPYLPIGPLYLFLIKVDENRIVYEPFYRGVPFWPECLFDGGKYADIRSAKGFRDVYARSKSICGMFLDTRAQYDAHYNAIYQHFLQTVSE